MDIIKISEKSVIEVIKIDNENVKNNFKNVSPIAVKAHRIAIHLPAMNAAVKTAEIRGADLNTRLQAAVHTKNST